MALDVLVSPGCRGVAEDYLDRALGEGDVLIDTGAIYTALTGSTAIPSSRPAVLALAVGLRTVAIRFARERGLNGIVRTGNGSRASITKLQLEAGGSVKVLQLDRAEACKRIRAIVTGDDRVSACESGLDRFYGRYVPEDTDEVVR